MTLISLDARLGLAASPRRRQAILALIAGLAALLALSFVWRAAKEAPDSNSYALVAQSLLTRTPDVPRCFDLDCAVRDGRTYVVFPPFPGVVAAPLVAAYGVDARGFVAIAIACLALSLLLWRNILRRLEAPPWLLVPLLAAIAFGSPLYYVTLHSDGVWFFAQAVAFPLVTLAIHETLAGRLALGGAALAAALLCRQMSVFYAPILLLLTLPPKEPLLALDRPRVLAALKLGAPILIGVALYLAYNAWRFGDPLDPGYRDIAFPAGLMRERVSAHGVWSSAYVVFNLFYDVLQGFHADFAEPERVRLTGLDTGGTSILAASPWLLYIFFAPARRDVAACAALILGLLAALLFYHSNGFLQYNAQRYMLDWLPAALLILVAASRRVSGETFGLLVLWAMSLNLATVVVLRLTGAA